MTERDWTRTHKLSMVVFLNGDAIAEPDPRGERVVDDSFLIIFNAWHEAIDVVIPVGIERTWTCLYDTADGLATGASLAPAQRVKVSARTAIVLKSPRAEQS